MLELKDVSCSYDQLRVLKDVSFSLKENEIVCIIGPNGCGKTTLLKAIAGLLPYTGSIKFHGSEIQDLKRKDLAKGIAFMSQISEMYFEYSIYETVMLGRYLHGKKGLLPAVGKEDEKIVERVLKDVELWQEKDKPITQLSGGQLQRVFLARTFAQEPKLILLDEPTNHLDLKYQLELMQRLQKWSKEKGHAVLGVFHDLNLAMQFAERIILLDQGEIALEGETQRVLQDQTLTKVFGVDVLNYMQGSLNKWVSSKERA